MVNLYCIYSVSLDHCSRYFIGSDDQTAKDKIRNSLFSGSDLGLFYGAEDDLYLCRVCSIDKFHVVPCDHDDFNVPLIDIPGVADFIAKVKTSAPAIQNNVDLENLHAGKKKKERR